MVIRTRGMTDLCVRAMLMLTLSLVPAFAGEEGEQDDQFPHDCKAIMVSQIRLSLKDEPNLASIVTISSNS